MGRINAIIPDKLEQRLREVAAKRGGKKGVLSTIYTEAITMWLEREKQRDREERLKNSPFEQQ